jgi:hypothetical protein
METQQNTFRSTVIRKACSPKMPRKRLYGLSSRLSCTFLGVLDSIPPDTARSECTLVWESGGAGAVAAARAERPLLPADDTHTHHVT